MKRKILEPDKLVFWRGKLLMVPSKESAKRQFKGVRVSKPVVVILKIPT
jgi:hypothetical protein